MIPCMNNRPCPDSLFFFETYDENPELSYAVVIFPNSSLCNVGCNL